MDLLKRTVEVKAPDESGSVEAVFSSDTPYQRYDFWTGEPYMEVLGHKDDEIDLSRLKNGAPLLKDHMPFTEDVLGKVESVSNDGHRASAKIRLADTPKANEVRELMRQGILGKVSVGYTVTEEEDDGEIGGVPVRRTKWLPSEISIVAVAADDSVGVTAVRKREARMAKETETETKPEAKAEAKPDTRDAEIERLKAELAKRDAPAPEVIFEADGVKVTTESSPEAQAMARMMVARDQEAKAKELAPNMAPEAALALLKGGATEEVIKAANAQAKGASDALSGIKGSTDEPAPETGGTITVTEDEINARAKARGEHPAVAKLRLVEDKARRTA